MKKNDLQKFLMYGVLACILYLPHLSITLYQLSVGGIGFSTGGWLAKPEVSAIYHFVKTLLGCGISGKLIMGLFLVIVLISIFRLNAISKKQVFLLWIFLINYSVIFCYSIFRNPILQFSVLLFSGVAFILFLSSFASFLKPKQIAFLCLGLMALMSFQTIRKKHFFSKVNLHEFETQVQVYQKMQRLVGKENVAYISGSEPFFMYVYEKKYHTKCQYLYTHDSTFLKKDRFTNYLKNLKQPYIVLCGVGAGTIQHVKQYFPYIVSNTDDYFSNVTVLSKYDYAYYDVSVLYATGLLNSDINIYIDSTKTIAFKKDAFEFKITPQDSTYPFGLSIPIKRTLVNQHQYLIGELSFIAKADSIEEDDQLCAAMNDSQGKTLFYTANKLKEFYNHKKAVQKVEVDIFAGSEFKKWYKEDSPINFFVKKDKKSNYTIKNFTLKVADYNPTKWTLWD